MLFFNHINLLTILSNQTFWTAVGAIAAFIAASGVWLAVRQIKFGGWLKAQEIFTHQNFIDAREEILKHFGYDNSIPSRIGETDEKSAKLVCRKMDELARLKSYLGKDTIIKTWGYPLGKSWMILKATVEQERIGHSGKWDAFQHLGDAAVKKLDLETLNKNIFGKRKKK